MLDGSFRRRFAVVKEIKETIEEYMTEGRTINEAIDSVGNVCEIVGTCEEDKTISRKRQDLYLFLYIIIGILAILLIVNNFVQIKNGVGVISILTSRNSSIFIASKTNIPLTVTKIVIDLILLLCIIKKIAKHYICYIKK
jgi:preprotein translocase subunit SecG